MRVTRCPRGRLTHQKRQILPARAPTPPCQTSLGAGDYVTIEVVDSGAGIPSAIRDRIFEPFFSTKQFGTGTGLGLSMVFGFAKQSGGGIVVDGEKGKGACFRIYLPKADVELADALVASDASPPEDDELRGGSETILCVEDDDVVRAHVTGRLESLGYTVITASNAAEALMLVNSGAAFDLLFTDIVMPGAMNGRQLAQKVAELRRPLRVLYTSGNTFGAFGSSVRPGEGLLLLKKPYRKAELARMVRLSPRPCDRPHGRSDPAALFGAGGPRAFSEGKSAEVGIGRFGWPRCHCECSVAIDLPLCRDMDCFAALAMT